MKKAILAIEDGVWFEGESFGAESETFGEVVFHTGLSGDQEILTDPSSKGQRVCMTYPYIENYGINPEDVKSRRSWVEGFIVKEMSPVASNDRSPMTLDQYLKNYNTGDRYPKACQTPCVRHHPENAPDRTTATISSPVFMNS